MSTPLNPMQQQDNTHRSQMTSELKSHEAAKALADEQNIKKAQEEEKNRKMREAQEMEEQDPLDPKNEEGKEHHLPDEQQSKKKKTDSRSTKSKKFMGGSMFDGFA